MTPYADANGRLVVLVVDDEPILRIDLCGLFEERGFAAIAATDGAEALQKFKADPPQLVITDIYMAGMDGLELIRSLRRLDTTTPIIAISGDSRRYDILKMARKLGADATLEKPVTHHDILQLARRLLHIGD
jgi:CheY-like chemotaxis protein